MNLPYFAPTRRSISFTTLLVVALLSQGAIAQTTLVPSSVTSSVEPFYNSSALSPSNLTLGITASTTQNSTFPYSPSSGFTTGTGYISQFGTGTAVLTFQFPTAVSVSRMMVWNAYFNFELDHSAKNVVIELRNASNTVLLSHNAQLPQATASNLSAAVVNLPQEVLGVRSIRVSINTLWGGNEVSLRRVAFAGNGLSVGLADASSDAAERAAYPVPAFDHVVIPTANATRAELLDATGRIVPVDAEYRSDAVTLRWGTLPRGAYFVRLYGREGTNTRRVLVGGY
ncbi:MAG: T9SS type A sorting domain-containing protein [Flavobacteriales bacterium]